MAKRFKYEIQGLEYITPEVPKYVRGSELPKKDQVWHRREEYLQWDWTIDEKNDIHWFSTASDEQKQWFEDEIERLHTGDWIMINGHPTYFNKFCYFFHQWFILQEGYYPTYKDTSLEYFRFYQLCEEDRFTLGDCGIKGRRVGLSSMSASIKLLLAILESNTLQGIVSKTGTDAKEMYLMVKNGMENLPPFLMPDLNKVTETELHVAKPAKRISKNNTKASADKGKNNRVNWLDTAENAYDGRKVRHVTVDEAAKWEKVNVQICISKITDTLVKGASVSGHMSVFSTVNKGDKGGDRFRAIWDGSDHIDGVKDRFGRTTTKMKRFFIPGYKGLLGYIGKYGESVIDTPTKEQSAYLATVIDPDTGQLACPDPTIGAKEYLMESRKMMANDPELLAEEIRKYPFEWQEVFKDANNLCYFNTEDLSNQTERVESAIEGLGRNRMKDENGRRGWFVKQPDGNITWKDDNKGMWYVLEFLKQDEANRFTIHNGIKCPDNTAYGAAGLDTFANAKQTVEKGSDAALTIHKRYNSLSPDNSNMPVAFFIGRPATKREFHDQIFNGLQYYGVKMLAERSPTDWEDYAIENKLASPLDAPKKYGYLVTTARANGSEVYGIAPQDKEAREQHLTEMIEYALYNMEKIWFIRILKDMFQFDIDKRTDFDGCMSWGYSLMALKENHQKVAPKKLSTPLIRKGRVVSRY